MELLNTLIVDSKDPKHRQKFIDDIENAFIINFIVLGEDGDSLKIVEKADLLADGHTGKIERKVAWIKDRALLKDLCMEYLNTFPGYDLSTYDKTTGFTLSPKFHECKYVFLEGNPTEDFNISKAYWKASLRERNEA